MTESKENDDDSFRDVEEKVKNWLSDLQQERKCNSTNIISKIVNKLSADKQNKIRELISLEIAQLIDECKSSNTQKNVQLTCNAINGCFDNFIHAADAVKLIFSDVISFIHFGIEDCTHSLANERSIGTSSLSKSLDLLHTLSRIMVLVLKLKRTQKKKETEEKNNLNEETKKLLVTLGNGIGVFLLMGDVSMDTKNNFAMASILIREIILPEEAFLAYHKSFVESIPSKLEENEYKLNILKFLLSSAVINTWSVNIIDEHSTNIYLNFFILLCETYSKEIPIVLNASRTLLLLIKHDCFKNYVASLNSDESYKTFDLLLNCVWMLLEHPTSCVRNSAKDYLQVLVAFPNLQSKIVKSVFSLPKEKRSFFIGLASLANELGTRKVIEEDKELPTKLLKAVHDPTIVSHVSFALERLMLKDSLGLQNLSKWCELWLIPLLISLTSVLPIVAADIEKLIEKSFKAYPNAIIYIIKKWDQPKNREELRYVITALKISHKQGYKLKNNSEVEDESSTKTDQKWKNLINLKLLKGCLHHGDDEIRMSAFSLIIEGHKSTEVYSGQDFDLIQYFLHYNLNNYQPATRQKTLGIIRKMLVRFTESRVTLRKPGKSVAEKRDKIDCLLNYEKFQNWLVEFCFSNMFPGANFNRLSTVLNILLMCLENFEDLKFSPGAINFYWKKILVVLESSYEENKEMALKLSKKLDWSLLDINKSKSVKELFDKAFDYCTHMEPPDVLTGSYLLQVLLNLPWAKEILLDLSSEEFSDCDEKYICVEILFKKLKEQVEVAKENLMIASVSGPMYGVLFAIRLLLQSVDFSTVQKENMDHWRVILNELIEVSFEMTDIVSVVVNSSSPEGHLPMDFQKDFENLLSGTLKISTEQTEQEEKAEAVNDEENDKLPEYDGGSDDSDCEISNPSIRFSSALRNVKKQSKVFLDKLEGVEHMMEEPDQDCEEIVNRLNDLLLEDKVLLRKWKQIQKGRKVYCKPGDRNYANEEEEEDCDDYDQITKFYEKRKHLNAYLQKYGVNKKCSTSTAQVLLLCSWRSIKEASLYLGDLVSKLPIENAINLQLLTEETIIKIGVKLRILLCEIKHRGAFEQAFIGFTQLITSLWKSTNPNLNELPNKWLEEILQQLKSPSDDPKLKFCPTRRSAGLPFMVQAIIATEVQLTKSAVAYNLDNAVKNLLEIAENITEETTESRIHSLNILRALFKHAQLGECIAPYVSRALMIAIRGSRAATWSERNSSSLLFSSLIIRIFGVARSRDEISKKNRMTSRTFFQRYSELYDFLLSEVEMFMEQDQSEGHHPQPTLYLILLILGRLYPSPSEDVGTVDLSAFLHVINNSATNATMKIRELGARALVSLISPDNLLKELDQRFNLLAMKNTISQNHRHGLLLQIKALLKETSDGSLQNEELLKQAKNWIESTKWYFDAAFNYMKNSKSISFVVIAAYIQVLHILFKKCPELVNPIGNIISDSAIAKKMSKFPMPGDKKSPGLYLFLENFYFLKLDVSTWTWLESNTYQNDKLCQLILAMLKNSIPEVQAIPLRFLRFLLRSEEDLDFDEEEDESFAAPIKDLKCLEQKDHFTKLRYQIFEYTSIKNYLAISTSKDDCPFCDVKIIKRLWVQVLTMLLLKNLMSIAHSNVINLTGDDIHPVIFSGILKKKDDVLYGYGLVGMSFMFIEKFEGNKEREYQRFFYGVLITSSNPEKDVRQRIAVAKIINRFWSYIGTDFSTTESRCLYLRMVPIKLLADDDPIVRKLMVKYVNLIKDYVVKNVDKKYIIAVMGSNVPTGDDSDLQPLKAQELLLDCYICLFAEKKFLRNLICQMIRLVLSSWIDGKNKKYFNEEEEEVKLDDINDIKNLSRVSISDLSDDRIIRPSEVLYFRTLGKNSNLKITMAYSGGVFEKGNPNPYLEELALTDLICTKLEFLNKFWDVKDLVSVEFNESQAENIRKFFGIYEMDIEPYTIYSVLETLTRLIHMETASSSYDKNYCSLARIQIEKLWKALRLKCQYKNSNSIQALAGLG